MIPQPRSSGDDVGATVIVHVNGCHGPESLRNAHLGSSPVPGECEVRRAREVQSCYECRIFCIIERSLLAFYGEDSILRCQTVDSSFHIHDVTEAAYADSRTAVLPGTVAQRSVGVITKDRNVPLLLTHVLLPMMVVR